LGYIRFILKGEKRRKMKEKEFSLQKKRNKKETNLRRERKKRKKRRKKGRKEVWK